MNVIDHSVHPMLEHQRQFFEKAKDKAAFALFAEMGLGKTKSAIDKALHHWSRGEINAVIVIAPKGVHVQWAVDQLKAHVKASVNIDAGYWAGSKVKHSERRKGAAEGKLFRWLCLNYDALKTPKGMGVAQEFCQAAEGRVLLIIDESQEIKRASTQRWKALFKLRTYCSHALLLSGTPISRDITDLWAQYKMLDESIIGCKWLTNFKAQYCIMGGFEFREVVGTRNLEHLQKRIDPYTFRITKKEATDLPEKSYHEEHFEMHPEEAERYRLMKAAFLADLGNGVYESAAHAAVALTRMQQITSGYLPTAEELFRFKSNRIVKLQEIVNNLSDEKILIWCRFTQDIEELEKVLPNSVTYYGATPEKQRGTNKAAFIDPRSPVRFMLSTPAAGGTGIDGYQTVCNTAIYYTNSFNAIHRWQSEDRIHRKGMKGSALYIDLVCRGGIDRKLLANLRKKKTISALMLDDIRAMVEGD